ENDAAIRKLVDSQVKGWISDPALIDADKAQNSIHAGLSQADIDALDKKWRAETAAGAKPMINEVLGRDASKKLVGHKNGGEGLFTEIFVMDNKGLNVAQSDTTSDYWQGDEAKWKKTFLAGPDGLFIDEVEFDESTQTYQAQVSVSIADPDSGEAIGAITIGVNVELLSN
ncbi:MAG: cache domain-containing protein, partial [Alphaproteobacteria bacterium]|nr:cache domain-containing protein [Alphaproteobacteria bacterium]